MTETTWWFEHLRYRIACAMFHQPLLLRWIAGLARKSAGLSSALSLAASATAVRTVLEREASFSRDHYPPVMIDGPFLIGVSAGPAHTHSRACLKDLLPSPESVAQHTVAALPELRQVALDRLHGGGHFDLIEDYMMPLVWSGICPSYGAQAAGRLASHRALFGAARWLGAQLMIGGVATSAVQQRALRSAALMEAAFGQADPLLRAQWPTLVPGAYPRQRDAIGLLWVGHPATTQGGALLMQELLSRPEVYRRLREDDSAGDPASAGLPSYRDRLRDHVLELLRFRPPFPLLGRQVPREALYPLGPDRVARARPGGIAALAIGALHDPNAQREDPSAYAPGRHFHRPADRYLMFGAGERHCIAQAQVIEILITALAGLLALDRTSARQPLRYANPRWRRIVYDGPVIAHMPLAF